jgi:hypothetical protein
VVELEMLIEMLSEVWELAEQDVRGKVTIETVFAIDPDA